MGERLGWAASSSGLAGSLGGIVLIEQKQQIKIVYTCIDRYRLNKQNLRKLYFIIRKNT
jgi:6-phosphofructokinase